jgi:hypothetical protein
LKLISNSSGVIQIGYSNCIMYQNREIIGGFATSGYPTYWSSSQKGTSSFSNFTSWINGISNAWVQFFFTGFNPAGTQSDLGKDNTRRVRAIRSF